MFITKPTLPRLLCMKSGKVYSLYTYKNAWDEEKKRSYREPGSTKIVSPLPTTVGGPQTPIIIITIISKTYGTNHVSMSVHGYSLI